MIQIDIGNPNGNPLKKEQVFETIGGAKWTKFMELNQIMDNQAQVEQKPQKPSIL